MDADLPMTDLETIGDVYYVYSPGKDEEVEALYFTRDENILHFHSSSEDADDPAWAGWRELLTATDPLNVSVLSGQHTVIGWMTHSLGISHFKLKEVDRNLEQQLNSAIGMTPLLHLRW